MVNPPMANSGAADSPDSPRPDSGPAAMPAENDRPRQTEVYRRYLHLQSLADRHFEASLAGRLVLSTRFGRSGAELALASTIAGAAFLGIEPGQDLLKTAVRNGSCNFMVNTLDEALRVLKNELRKRQPVSVGLLGPTGDLLAAMIERGVQPDLLCDTVALRDTAVSSSSQPTAATQGNVELEAARTVHRPALLQFFERGAVLIDPPIPSPSTQELEVTWTATSLQDMQRMDKLAMKVLPDPDMLHRRWLQGAAASFHRQRPLERVIGLPQPVLQQLLDALARSNRATPFAAPASIHWRKRDGSIEEVAW